MASVQSQATDILLVEDDETIAAILAAVLRDQGYTVCRASNGMEALEHLHKEPPPRLILLNLMMPVMNGWKFREQLREVPELAQIPVVLLSGVRDLDRKAAALEATDCFTKPYNLKAVLDAVRYHCHSDDPTESVAKPAELQCGLGGSK
jgi:DNA-binding response OmpR family regulator